MYLYHINKNDNKKQFVHQAIFYCIENMKKTDEIENILEECKFLLAELLAITKENDITAEDFKTMKKS